MTRQFWSVQRETEIRAHAFQPPRWPWFQACAQSLPKLICPAFGGGFRPFGTSLMTAVHGWIKTTNRLWYVDGEVHASPPWRFEFLRQSKSARPCLLSQCREHHPIVSNTAGHWEHGHSTGTRDGFGVGRGCGRVCRWPPRVVSPRSRSATWLGEPALNMWWPPCPIGGNCSLMIDAIA